MTNLQPREESQDTAMMRAIVGFEREGLMAQAQEYRLRLAYQWLGINTENGLPNTTALAYSLLGMVLKAVPVETPKEFKKNRKIRGGKTADYVEVGYIKQVLNTVFGPFWDFTRIGLLEYLTDSLHATDGRLGIITLRARLTVHIPTPLGWVDIVKEAVGEAEIQRYSEKGGANAGKAVNIGDDEKAAESDALKRAASYFGIAADVYWGKDEIAQYESLNNG